jgi:hypothetical protein
LLTGTGTKYVNPAGACLVLANLFPIINNVGLQLLRHLNFDLHLKKKKFIPIRMLHTGTGTGT